MAGFFNIQSIFVWIWERFMKKIYLVATNETKVFKKDRGLVVVSIFSKRSCPDQAFPHQELGRLIGVYEHKKEPSNG